MTSSEVLNDTEQQPIVTKLHSPESGHRETAQGIRTMQMRPLLIRDQGWVINMTRIPITQPIMTANLEMINLFFFPIFR